MQYSTAVTKCVFFKLTFRLQKVKTTTKNDGHNLHGKLVMNLTRSHLSMYVILFLFLGRMMLILYEYHSGYVIIF